MKEIAIKTAHGENDDVGGFYAFAVWSMFRDGRYCENRDRRRGVEAWTRFRFVSYTQLAHMVSLYRNRTVVPPDTSIS